MRRAITAFALLFLAAHLCFLPPTLEDIDSVNFALGVADFDVAKHQPHPPGYPVFIALGKISTPLVRAVGIDSPEARGLALWSALSGAALIYLLFAFFRALAAGSAVSTSDSRTPRPEPRVPASGSRIPDPGPRVALGATVMVALSPLFWFTALRPLSDMAGLAAAVAAQALVVSVITGYGRPAALTWGALLAGLAIGIRSQTFLLTLPLLALALVLPRLGVRLRDRLTAIAAVSMGVAIWGIPLIVASGGLSSYAVALGSQAGEDFSGVVMLWNVRALGLGATARVGLDALRYSLLWPWGHPLAGVVVVVAALAGCVRLAWKMPRVLGLLIVAFVPYAIFHVLFHEVVTVRYALPLVIPAAYLAACALEWGGGVVLAAGVAALAAWSLAVAVPATISYGREGSPAFRALGSVERAVGVAATQATTIDAVGFHAVLRRAVQWEGKALKARTLEARHGREWLALVEQWRTNPASHVAFIADPRRTDLALFDPRARQLNERFVWGFVEPPFVGGARPGDSDLYTMSPPGWMLDRGWALTAEVAGVTAVEGFGPHRKSSVAWIRARSSEATLMLGGRHLGSGADPEVRINLSVNGRPLEPFTVRPGFFFTLIALPAGALAAASQPAGSTSVVSGSTTVASGSTSVVSGSTAVASGSTSVVSGFSRTLNSAQPSYIPLEVKSEAADGSGRAIPVALEQFDLQAPGSTMVGADAGWQEPEYNPLTARSWRWMTERATLWVRPVGRDVILTLTGESPLRYYDAAPAVTVTVGGRQVARFNPAADFTQDITLPAAALASADGRVVIESDKWFVPGERDGTADRRHLALRVYSYSVR